MDRAPRRAPARRPADRGPEDRIGHLSPGAESKALGQLANEERPVSGRSSLPVGTYHRPEWPGDESNALRSKIWERPAPPRLSTSFAACPRTIQMAEGGEECPVVKALKHGETTLGWPSHRSWTGPSAQSSIRPITVGAAAPRRGGGQHDITERIRRAEA